MELDMILRGIVMTRGDAGATIGEMFNDYFDMMGKPWPLNRRNNEQTIRYLLEIDGLMMEETENGPYVWYIDDIGSNVSSEQEIDTNNNIVVINDSSVAMTSVLDSQQAADRDSYAIKPPRRIISSSFANGRAISLSTSDSLIEAAEHLENGIFKRTVSQDNSLAHNEQKRQKLLKPGRLPLNEENLDIHNRNSGANSPMKQTTSTEIAHSNTTQPDLNRCILVNDDIAPIKAPRENLRP